MPNTDSSTRFRPMNVVVAPGSRAEKHFRALAVVPGVEGPILEAIVPGMPATPKHNLRFYGGKTIPNLTFTNFYIGGASSWQDSDIKSIDQALSAAMSDKNLNNVMMQYFGNNPITSVFKPSQVLEGKKPSSFSQGDVEALVAQLHSQGKLDGYDLSSTVFNFMLPSGTVLTTDEEPSQPAPSSTAGTSDHDARARKNPVHPEEEVSSTQGLGGYHGSVHPSKDVTLYYAIGAYSEKGADGQENGIVAFDQSWKNIVAVFYHELNEARTDPDVEDAIRAGDDPKAMKFIGWMSSQGEECGDFPVSESGMDLSKIMVEVPLTDGNGTVPVQLQYSNAVKGPEGPIPAPHPLPKTPQQPATGDAMFPIPIHPINTDQKPTGK